MKMLRLIKPWRLRAVRLRLGDDRDPGGPAQALPCSFGPVSMLEEAAMPGHPNNSPRGSYHNSSVPTHTNRAPHSSVIFVTSNNPKIR
jgi:hypothetical protein